MTPPDQPPSNPYDPNWPQPERPAEGGSGATSEPGGTSEPPSNPYASNPYASNPYDHGATNPYQASSPPAWGEQTGQQPGQQPGQAAWGEQPGQQSQPAWGQQPGYGQPAYGQPTYGGQYGAAQPHGSATTALVLGLVSLGGIVFCAGFTLPLSPFAWWIGGKAVKEIDANPSAFSGRDQAQAGRIMGIIGTVLLVLGIVAIIALIAIGFAAADQASTVTYDSPPSDSF